MRQPPPGVGGKAGLLQRGPHPAVGGIPGLFLPALPEWLAGKVWLLYGAGNLVFLLYDWGLSRLIGMMTARLKLR